MKQSFWRRRELEDHRPSLSHEYHHNSLTLYQCPGLKQKICRPPFHTLYQLVLSVERGKGAIYRQKGGVGIFFIPVMLYDETLDLQGITDH